MKSEDALDPNATLQTLYELAADFPDQVLANPVLSLYLLAQPETVELVRKCRRARILLHHAKANLNVASDVFYDSEKINEPEIAPSWSMSNQGLSSHFTVGYIGHYEVVRFRARRWQKGKSYPHGEAYGVTLEGLEGSPDGDMLEADQQLDGDDGSGHGGGQGVDWAFDDPWGSGWGAGERRGLREI